MLQLLLGIFGMLIVGSHPQAQPLALENIADGVYVHHGIHEDLSEGYHGDICNISFIVGSNGVAVIDTGGTLKTGQHFHETIRKVTRLPVLYVINTHVHPDHIYGNAAFTDDKPQFVGHAKLADAMELRKDAYARTHKEWLGDEFAGSEIIKPTLAIKDELTLDLGDRQLRLSAHPTAHTNTDLTVIDSKTNTLWTGDLLFVERTPSIDGDIKGWIAVAESLSQLTVAQVVPGHGPVVKDWKQAFIDQQRYLSTLLNDVRASIKKGEVMESAMNTAAASEKDRWALFGIVNRRNVNIIYPSLEWE
ncbi:Metallo-beta-lactamase type 2 [Methylophilaceae bacterium]|nr:Metallo-beta-lactamase type 2 [Methylophilaceae bacterium]